MLLFNQNKSFEHIEFWKLGAASLKFYLDLQQYVLLKIENGFHCVVSSRWEYLNSQRFENLVFWKKKITRLSRHSFENERGQSEILFCFTNKYCGQYRDPLFKDRYDIKDRKWFLLTRLFSFQIFEDAKTQKCCFLNKTTPLSRHSFEKWVWSVLKFAYFNRDA